MIRLMRSESARDKLPTCFFVNPQRIEIHAITHSVESASCLTSARALYCLTVTSASESGTVIFILRFVRESYGFTVFKVVFVGRVYLSNSLTHITNAIAVARSADVYIISIRFM